MADNRLSAISDKGFTSLYKLRIANFSNNNLTLYNYESQTEYGSMVAGIDSPFAFCFSLEELYLSNNGIVQIFRDWINLQRLQILDLKKNYILTVSVSIFKAPIKITNVFLLEILIIFNTTFLVF